MTIDDLVDEYAKKAEKVYEQRTAGDYTWLGLFAEFAHRAENLRIVNLED